MTTATHLSHEDSHAVLLDELRVLVVPDGAGFFARGLEIDYFSCGETADEATNRFTRGLAATLAANIGRFGHIQHVLRSSPREVLDEYEAQEQRCFMQVLTLCEIARNQHDPVSSEQFRCAASAIGRLRVATAGRPVEPLAA